MPYRKRIQIYWQSGVTKNQILIAKIATELVLLRANAVEKVLVRENRSVKLDEFKNEVGPYADSPYANSLYADGIIHALSKRNTKYYTVILTHDKLYFHQAKKLEKINGLANLKSGIAIVCVGNSKKFDNIRKEDEIMCTVMHELGHIFGLLPDNRTKKIIFSFGTHKHCAGMCVMYPDDSVSSKLNLINTPFCFRCLHSLRDFFIE